MYFLVVLAFDMTSIVYLLSIKDSKLVFNTTSSASGIVDSHKTKWKWFDCIPVDFPYSNDGKERDTKTTLNVCQTQ